MAPNFVIVIAATVLSAQPPGQVQLIPERAWPGQVVDVIHMLEVLNWYTCEGE